MPNRFRSRIRELKQQRQLERDLHLVQSSDLFDREWYLQKYPEVVQAGLDPLWHFLNYGGFEGRNPGPNFFSSWYLEKYEDVRKNGMNPLLHYLKYGQKEGREASPPLFKLRRMYDYSKETSRIVFEEPPERIYLKRPQVIGEFSGLLEEGEAVCPRPYVSVLEDTLVFGGRNLVLVEGKLVLSDELVDFNSPKFGVKSSGIEFVNDGEVIFTHYKEVNVHVKEAVLLSCGHDNNYFHWLVECLPKLLLIDSLPEFKEVPLLIPTGLHKNLMVALERVNINKRPLIFIEPDAACRVDRLIFPSTLSRVVDRYEGAPAFNIDSVLSHKWLARVSECLKAGAGSRDRPWRKLFLTRREGNHLLENWEQMELVLLQHGFEIVQRLDEVSLDFQVELFSRATVIVAPTGAALTNLLFCQPGIKVIVLMSNHERSNYYFWSNLGAVNNLDVTTILGERLSKVTDSSSVHDAYIVDPSLVLEQIQKYEQGLMINQPESKAAISESPALLKLQEILTGIKEATLQFVETHTKSDSWASSRLSIQFVRVIRAILMSMIKWKGLDPENDEYLLRLAFILSSPHIVDYFYYRSGGKEITSIRWLVPTNRARSSLFVLQCLAQPSFRINYPEIETLLDQKNLWPLIISKGVEYRFFFNRQSDLEMQFDFLHQNIKTFIDYLNSGKSTDFKQYLRWYVASPPIGFSIAAREVYELYRVLEQDTLMHFEESLPPFQRSTEQSQDKTVRIGFLFLSLMSGVESKVVLKTLECVPENYQIIMIGLNDQEYSPEIEANLTERKIQLALVDQSSVTDTLASLRRLNLDILFYCAPFWGSFLSRIALICAARVAPLQISYIGDVITSGLLSCDYFILPPIPDKSQMRPRFTEEIMIVPNAIRYLLSPPLQDAKGSSSKNGNCIVYFSHAHMWKLNGDLLDAWAQILSRVDRAVIRLAPFKSAYHKSYLPALQEFIVRKCKKWGVSAKRFEIIDDAGAHLMQKQLVNADVYLDSFPYTGATSLLEVLSESLPVVSLAGESYPELLSKVVLSEFDLEEDTVASSQEAYVAKAVALGQDTTLRNEVSLKIKKKVAEAVEHLDKTEIFPVFWAEVEKRLRHGP